MKYTELELNKMIAELEGFTVCDKRSVNNLLMIKLKNKNKSNPEFRFAPYFPNYFDLMVKYKVNKIHHNDEGEGDYHEIWIDNEYCTNTTLGHVDHLYGPNLERLVIMCILKSENII